ncbi:phosphate acetyltransferase [Tessaracoccus antarcticus]|uniref:Phosphate acetyltransferase n=1 Tax=Tessaracoccus antarcticus TaxID=2479848 RepID=A0A3M0GAT3_9ACTN|nr:phosphate acetyltransferase [Tessaracoccus antarcticus]RMB59602.1 phosphate acetyltransferase [Tessaracoccus antarcticus]
MTAQSLFLLSTTSDADITGLVARITAVWGRNHKSIAVFSPFTDHPDTGLGITHAGVGLMSAFADRASTQSYLLDLHGELLGTHDAVLVVGSAGGSALAALEFDLNAELAANLGTPALLVVDEAAEAAAIAAARARHVTVRGTLRPDAAQASDSSLVVSGADVDELLRQLKPGCVVVLDAQRQDVQLALAVAGMTGRATPASIVCCGTMDPAWTRLLQSTFPGVTVENASAPRASVATALRSACGRSRLDADVAVSTQESVAMTPLRFEHLLLRRARAARQHIVLPEGDEPRILLAAAALLTRGVCRLTLLGDPLAIKAKAAELGADISCAEFINPADSEHLEQFAMRYAELRAKKGVTLEQAREKVTDVSYFGTMMVLEGLAGGMVSGAAHTTAHTIRPALEVIRTRPGVSVVSSVVFMCLADHVLVFGDCAVNPNPTPIQLADIAISSAATARDFGIEPRVAMLSYSTGQSGLGSDVDLVAEATALVAKREPGLLVDGPLQFDAAVDPGVARSKRPGSPVAGRATVLVFPDLDAGNIAYKAVQRTAGALAIGQVLQGLNKPVNDLSRGATVGDIVNTIAITAVQASEVQ